MRKITKAGLATAAMLCLVVGLAQPASATRKSRVSVAASAGVILAGNAVTFSGSVRPSGKRPIQLQQHLKSKWSTVHTTHTATSGHYSIRWVVTRAGYSHFRVRVSSSRSASVGFSSAVNILARRWHYLSDLNAVDGNGEMGTGAVEVNGTRFQHSVTDFDADSDEADYVEYNLARKCVTFRGVLGTEDTQTDSGGTAQMDVAVDGNNLFGQNFGLGQSTRVSENIKGHLRLHLDAQSTNENANVSVGFGNAEILCNF